MGKKMKNKFLLLASVAGLMFYTAQAFAKEDLHSVDILETHFQNTEEFTQWYGTLNQADKNLVLSGAVYECRPDLVKTAIELGGDAKTDIAFYSIETYDKDASYNSPIYIFNKEDDNTSDVFNVFEYGNERCSTAWKDREIKFCSYGGYHRDYFISLPSLVIGQCSSNLTSMLELFLSDKDLINKTNEFSVSPLSEAILAEDINTAKFLLQNGADFNKTFALSQLIDHYRSCQHCSGKSKMLDFAVSYLQKHPLSIEAKTDAYIHWALKNDEELQQKLDVLNLQPDYTTLAAKKGLILIATRNNCKLLGDCGDINYDLLKELIDKGVDVNYQDEYGKTALFYLTKTEYPHKADIDIIKYLLEHGADANIKDKNGKTAFDNCAYAICKLNPNGLENSHVNDKTIASTLDNALDNYDCDTITYFIKNGVDPYFDTRSWDGGRICDSALIIRLISSKPNQVNKQCLENILKLGIDLNKKIIDCNNVYTPLTYAYDDRYYDIKWVIPLLKQYGAEELSIEDAKKIQDFYDLKEQYEASLEKLYKASPDNLAEIIKIKEEAIKIRAEVIKLKAKIIKIKNDIQEKLNHGNMPDWETTAYEDFIRFINGELEQFARHIRYNAIGDLRTYDIKEQQEAEDEASRNNEAGLIKIKNDIQEKLNREKMSDWETMAYESEIQYINAVLDALPIISEFPITSDF